MEIMWREFLFHQDGVYDIKFNIVLVNTLNYHCEEKDLIICWYNSFPAIEMVYGVQIFKSQIMFARTWFQFDCKKKVLLRLTNHYFHDLRNYQWAKQCRIGKWSRSIKIIYVNKREYTFILSIIQTCRYVVFSTKRYKLFLKPISQTYVTIKAVFSQTSNYNSDNMSSALHNKTMVIYFIVCIIYDFITGKGKKIVKIQQRVIFSIIN